MIAVIAGIAEIARDRKSKSFNTEEKSDHPTMGSSEQASAIKIFPMTAIVAMTGDDGDF